MAGKKTTQVDISEESSTGGTASFTPGTGEQYAAAPHIPNRKSKAIDYKQLFEDSPGPIYKDWDEFVNPHYIIVHLNDGRKLKIARKAIAGGDKIYHAILKAFRDDIYKITNPLVAKMVADLDGGINLTAGPAWAALKVNKAINENYARFRNETSKRTAPEQLHKASKAIKSKLEEVSKLIEYTNQLRSEISENAGDVKYMKHTERTLEQISEMIKQIYIKSKKLK